MCFGTFFPFVWSESYVRAVGKVARDQRERRPVPRPRGCATTWSGDPVVVLGTVSIIIWLPWTPEELVIRLDKTTGTNNAVWKGKFNAAGVHAGGACWGTRHGRITQWAREHLSATPLLVATTRYQIRFLFYIARWVKWPVLNFQGPNAPKRRSGLQLVTLGLIILKPA